MVFVRTKDGRFLHIAACVRAARSTHAVPWTFADGLTLEEVRIAVAESGIRPCGYCRPLAEDTRRFARTVAACDHPETNRGRRSWSMPAPRTGGVTTVIKGVRKREWCLLCGRMLIDDVKPAMAGF